MKNLFHYILFYVDNVKLFKRIMRNRLYCQKVQLLVIQEWCMESSEQHHSFVTAMSVKFYKYPNLIISTYALNINQGILARIF